MARHTRSRSYLFAITGASGAGKTTLCHAATAALKKIGINAGMVHEAARDSQYLHAGDRSLAMHVEVLGLHISNEMRARRMHRVVVCDRSVVDFLTYAELRFGAPVKREDAILFAYLQSAAQSYARLYDHIFVPAPYNLADRHHDVDPLEMHRSTLDRLQSSELPYTLLDKGNRIEIVLAKIGKTISPEST
jgi:ABC-type dipeptide/oligopeptide/nickel transport system ATPase component